MIGIKDGKGAIENHLNDGDKKPDSRASREEVNNQIVLDVQLEVTA